MMSSAVGRSAMVPPTRFQATRPERETTIVAGSAMPCATSNTPYAFAVAPFGSERIGYEGAAPPSAASRERRRSDRSGESIEIATSRPPAVSMSPPRACSSTSCLRQNDHQSPR